MVDTPSVNTIDFPGKDQAEAIQFYYRQHWIRLWRPFRNVLLWLIAIAVAVVAIKHTFQDTPTMRRVVLLSLYFLFLFTQLSFLSACYRYFLYVVIVTDKKIHRIKKTLLTVDEHQSIDLWNLEDITKHQRGIVQNVFGFGTLELTMQSQDALRIHFTPFIAKKHEAIMQLREHARQRMMPQRMGGPH